jgi:hypothetical protein
VTCVLSAVTRAASFAAALVFSLSSVAPVFGVRCGTGGGAKGLGQSREIRAALNWRPWARINRCSSIFDYPYSDHSSPMN